MNGTGLIDLLLGLPLVVLVALVCSLVLAASALAVLLVAGNGRDDDDDPQREAERVDSIRAELDVLAAMGEHAPGKVVSLRQASERPRVRAGTPPPATPPNTQRINVDTWSQP